MTADHESERERETERERQALCGFVAELDERLGAVPPDVVARVENDWPSESDEPAAAQT